MGSQIPQHDLKACIKLDKDQVLDNLHSNFRSTKIQSPKKLALHVRFHDDPIIECNSCLTDNTWELHCLLCDHYFNWPIRPCPNCESVQK